MTENDMNEQVKEEQMEVKEFENPLEQQVLPEGPLKNFIVDYVGNKMQPENNMVTLDMIVRVVADEFPEFVLGIAEENWLKGYQQALTDLDAMQQETSKVEGSVDTDFEVVKTDEQA